MPAWLRAQLPPPPPSFVKHWMKPLPTLLVLHARCYGAEVMQLPGDRGAPAPPGLGLTDRLPATDWQQMLLAEILRNRKSMGWHADAKDDERKDNRTKEIP